MKMISEKEAFDRILTTTKGHIFSAHIVKDDKTERLMNCKLNVERLKKGGEMAYNPYERLLIPVVDTNLDAYRMIDVKRAKAIQIDGELFTIEHAPA